MQQASHEQQVAHVAELAAAEKRIVVQQTMREDDVADVEQESTNQVAAIKIKFGEIQQEMEQANNIKIAELEQEKETKLAELKQSNKIELFTAEKKFVEMQV